MTTEAKDKTDRREIKFRAWDKSGKQMVSPDYITRDGCGFWQENGIPTMSKILMQFTGLKDKNGKEIYEGDIVEARSAGSKGTFEIIWRQEGSPCYILYPAWQGGQMWSISATGHYPGKAFISVDGKVERTDRLGYYDDGLEVIGNIYENGDLLTNGK